MLKLHIEANLSYSQCGDRSDHAPTRVAHSCLINLNVKDLATLHYCYSEWQSRLVMEKIDLLACSLGFFRPFRTPRSSGHLLFNV